MALDEKLLEILACPNCHGDLDYRADDDLLVCAGPCGYRYPIRDGIPVLLIDEAVRPGDPRSNEEGPAES